MTPLSTPDRTARRGGNTPVATSVLRTRRAPARIVAGALLTVVLAVAFMWIQLRGEHRVAVLAVARPIAAGQPLAMADLRVTTLLAAPGVALVTAAQTGSVLGRPAAVPLLPGTLLSPRHLGPATWPPPGQAVVAVPVKPGRLPAGTGPGARVRVLALGPAADSAAGTDSTAGAGPLGGPGVPATVVEVTPDADTAGTVLVSVQLDDTAAAQVATAGEAALVLLGPAG